MTDDERREYSRKELYRMVLDNPLGEALLEDLKESFQYGHRGMYVGVPGKLEYLAGLDDLFEHIRAMLAVESIEHTAIIDKGAHYE